MKTVSFYPGPSRVYPKVPNYVEEAYDSGILGMNHRSQAFEALYAETVGLVREKLGVPKDYQVFFVGSATECWEIIAQSLMLERSFHIYNGAFGAKWLRYTRRLHEQAAGYTFDKDETLDPELMLIGDDTEVLCLTHSETANGTMLSQETMRWVRELYPDRVIAVDATSSLGGVAFDYTSADVWFASVQKCLGLPAGMAVMICSPRAMDYAEQLEIRDHYNSLVFIADNAKKCQTPHTPSTLHIFLLNRVLANNPPITEVAAKLQKRREMWYDFFGQFVTFAPYVQNETVRSDTVITLQSSPETVKTVLAKTQQKGYVLGKGYGELAETTFRIANFPALKKKEIEGLREVLGNLFE